MAAPHNGYTILLTNTGKDGDGPSPSAKRQEAFTRIVEEVKPSIIFTQECTGPFAKELGEQYLKLGVPDAGFIYNVNEFVHNDFTQDTDLARLVKRLTRDQKISTDFQFLGRVRVVRFTSKGVPGLDILALSWHGQYSRLNAAKKIEFLKELFVVVKEIKKLEKFRDQGGKMLPVIVGGDFNIEVTKWPSDPDLIYHMYTPSDRRKDRLIDLFVSTKELAVKNCKPVDMSFKLKDGDVASDFLKHDPVMGELSFSGDIAGKPQTVQTDKKKASPKEKPQTVQTDKKKASPKEKPKTVQTDKKKASPKEKPQTVQTEKKNTKDL
ncbi:uncharacterized protein LOC135498483 [Lineus longissimus]|uniref:uncharacterized protein LOC135498483 n=1 Tax=Lineus longissimus TaxID=88925 RepID=UPI002B4E42D4